MIFPSPIWGYLGNTCSVFCIYCLNYSPFLPTRFLQDPLCVVAQKFLITLFFLLSFSVTGSIFFHLDPSSTTGIIGCVFGWDASAPRLIPINPSIYILKVVSPICLRVRHVGLGDCEHGTTSLDVLQKRSPRILLCKYPPLPGLREPPGLSVLL